MICRNCIRAAARTRTFQLSSSQSLRPLSTCTPLRNATPISPNTATQTAPPTSSSTTPGATSTSATPELPATAPASRKEAPAKEKAHPTVKSSVPAGTPLKGLNFLKNKEDPVAKEDSEYPNWLWEILTKQEKKAEAGAAGDLFSKSKKQRRLAAKRLRKEQLAHPESFVKKVPIYEQTIDLPTGDGTLQGAVQAASAREELTKAMRNKRRATIKEANFLKAMG